MATASSDCMNLLSIDVTATLQLQQQRSLTVVSYNMHGFSQGFSTVRDLSASAIDVFLLQEHWLTPSNLNKFDIFTEYFTFGSSAMTSSVETGIIRGRPFGGVVALIKNELRPFTQTICCTERYVILKLFNTLIVNVYLPCAGTSDRLLISDDILCDISTQLEKFHDCVWLIGGDFNSDLGKFDHAAAAINSFLADRNFVRCDVAVGCKADYTYCNDSLNCHSYIDYFLTSDASRVVKFSVVDEGSNLSDHLPIAVTFNFDVINSRPNNLSSNDNTKEATQSYLRWDHADLISYYELTGRHLADQHALLKEIIGLENVSAINSDCIKSAVNEIYNKIVEILRNCANITVPERRKQFYKFWWNEELDCLKQQSIDDHKLWKTMGKPRHGPIFDRHRASKLLYKQRIREFQRNETSAYSNALHEALLEKNGPTFWKCWRSKFESGKTRPGQVDGLVDDNDIVSKFVNYFAEASSNLTEEGSSNLQQIYENNRPNYCGSSHSEQYDFDCELIDNIVHNMKHGKASGLDGLTVEHLLHCHPVIYSLLSEIFNLFIKYGFVPDEFGRSYTVPLPKGNSVNKAMAVDDFRGISISPVISKVFESCILNRYSGFLVTSDNQFGFKKGLGCSHAIYSVRCVVGHYTRNGSTVNLCALDLKKAFDKMNHHGLYMKLMDRFIPNNLLTVLEYWYGLCTTCVRWGNVFSTFFQLKCGVRQGGVLSPYLFACYIDDIVETLQRSGHGCNIKCVPVCIFFMLMTLF